LFLTGTAYTQRRIFLFWLPLAASWLLMSLEGPVLQAVIARLGDIQTQLAAFGIVVSLEIAIESPVIMLLATSTALATSARNYGVLRTFVISLNTIVTVVAVLVAFTPLFDLIVRRIMGIPRAIADAAQPGLMIMFAWSAAIGFRRFLQGILIRHGQTRWIGYGTVSRLSSSAGTGIVLAVFTSLPGVYIGSIALIAGVVTEAVFVAFVARPTIRRVLDPPVSSSDDAVTFADVLKFHMPLAATSLLTLLAQPLIGAGLARMPHPRETLAAWPVIWGVLFIFRSAAFALPEAVIALVSEPLHRGPVRRFCRIVGVASSAAMLLLTATPLIRLYLRYLAGLPDHLAGFVTPGLLLLFPLPFVNSIHSWYRGILMSARKTGVIYWGMGINLTLTGAIVFAGVLLRCQGVEAAAIALIVALVVELYYLRKRA
jgi:hypothetical protein